MTWHHAKITPHRRPEPIVICKTCGSDLNRGFHRKCQQTQLTDVANTYRGTYEVDGETFRFEVIAASVAWIENELKRTIPNVENIYAELKPVAYSPPTDGGDKGTRLRLWYDPHNDSSSRFDQRNPTPRKNSRSLPTRDRT